MGGSLAAVVLAAAWVATWRPQLDPDAWWHIAIGESIAATGAIPSTEPFSWLTAGGPFVAHSWLWDVLLAGGVAGGRRHGHEPSGPAGHGGHRVAPVATGRAGGAGDAAARAGRAGPGGRGRDAADVGAAGPDARRRVRAGDRARPRRATCTWAIGAASSRCRSSGCSGPTCTGARSSRCRRASLIALVALPIGVRWGAWPRRAVGPIVVAGLAGVAAMLVNPYGPRLLAYPFDRGVASAFSPAIVEWGSPDFGPIELLPFRVLLAALLPVAIWIPARSRDPFLLLTAAAWVFAALGSVRFLAIAGPLLVVALAPAVGAALGRWLGAAESSEGAAERESAGGKPPTP